MFSNSILYDLWAAPMAMPAMLLLLASLSASICEPQIASDSSLKKKEELEDELEGLQELLLSFEKSVGEKNMYAHERDKEILSLQKDIQELKEHNKERLMNYKAKIAKEQGMAENLEEILERKIGERDDLKRHIEVLENSQEQQIYEVEQLEQTSEIQRRNLAEIQKILHVTEESAIKLQSYLKSKTEELDKAYEQWVSSLAINGCACFLQNIEDLWIYVLKKGKHGILIVSEFPELLKSKGVKFAVVHWNEGQSALKNKLKAAIELSRPYTNVLVSFLQPYVDEFGVYTKPSARRLTQHFGEVLKSAVLYHRKLQRNIWTILKRDKYLAAFAASKVIIWLLATGLLLFPLYGAFQLVSFYGYRRGTFRTQRHAR